MCVMRTCGFEVRCSDECCGVKIGWKWRLRLLLLPELLWKEAWCLGGGIEQQTFRMVGLNFKTGCLCACLMLQKRRMYLPFKHGTIGASCLSLQSILPTAASLACG